MEAFDEPNFVHPVLDGSGQIALGLADQGPAFFREDGVVFGRRFGKDPAKVRRKNTRANFVCALVEPVKDLVVQIIDLVPFVHELAAAGWRFSFHLWASATSARLSGQAIF